MSDKIKDGGPAFPQPNHLIDTSRGREQARGWMDDSGMTLRDWFAGMALQGYIASVTQSPDCQDAAKICYEYANAMLAQREKGTKS